MHQMKRVRYFFDSNEPLSGLVARGGIERSSVSLGGLKPLRKVTAIITAVPFSPNHFAFRQRPAQLAGHCGRV